ncbi:uncharacterized protein CLUP02_07860 [Colletotrichum lupini]|uniref:Uncharacterized protein n=1 Tax=Colletotrichum lupini TaxID=145971 RepID=A0A9Q8WGW8_9PEZI|nr:uncharacterized protein CLUP02_07860 [Colletotrichum lupini]KAK1718521.1 hypothetical protein BDP67DRAFT_505738 [Colletotrichum lupini]UQC82372.1 hypothetical protein CLUP02_07860 [Colletotrichum lupini]
MRNVRPLYTPIRLTDKAASIRFVIALITAYCYSRWMEQIFKSTLYGPRIHAIDHMSEFRGSLTNSQVRAHYHRDTTTIDRYLTARPPYSPSKAVS